MSRSLLLSAVAAVLIAAALAGHSAEQQVQTIRSLVLLTLDTTRADYLGAYGIRNARTPNLDALAARGVRYRAAVTPSPLTLPAHTSLLTGLTPPEHGARDNGGAALSPEVPTLATVLGDHGYATAAFLSSRVLDRRFGLARGFARYDDRMAAERTGEYGYPERNAAAVSDAALAWLSQLDQEQPYFVWVHYYDPHAPYQPPDSRKDDSDSVRYGAEIAYMDGQIGRLLAALPTRSVSPIVVAVGDHGEALGEHGERTHGIFLYDAVLRVPLIIAGDGLPAGRAISEVVGTVRLAPTLLRLLGIDAAGSKLASVPSLPGLPGLNAPAQPQPVFSETRLPATAYGWSPLSAVSDQHWRYILAPRPELYDLRSDAREQRNLVGQLPEQAQRLSRMLTAWQAGGQQHTAGTVPADPELSAALRSLGYLADSAAGNDGIDPKEGVHLLARLEEAKIKRMSGRSEQAVQLLRSLRERNPHNVPFLAELGRAELAAGDGAAALATLRTAVGLAPGSEFQHLNLAHALRRLGRAEEAVSEYERVLAIDSRSAPAWLNLADLAGAEGERKVLQRAVQAGTGSVTVLVRLARLEMAAGDTDAADAHLAQAARLAPESALPWLEWGRMAEASGQLELAGERYEQAFAAEPGNPESSLCLGRLELLRGEIVRGRLHLTRAVALGAQTETGEQARRLLEELR